MCNQRLGGLHEQSTGFDYDALGGLADLQRHVVRMGLWEKRLLAPNRKRGS